MTWTCPLCGEEHSVLIVACARCGSPRPDLPVKHEAIEAEDSPDQLQQREPLSEMAITRRMTLMEENEILLNVAPYFPRHDRQAAGAAVTIRRIQTAYRLYRTRNRGRPQPGDRRLNTLWGATFACAGILIGVVLLDVLRPDVTTWFFPGDQFEYWVVGLLVVTVGVAHHTVQRELREAIRRSVAGSPGGAT